MFNPLTFKSNIITISSLSCCKTCNVLFANTFVVQVYSLVTSLSSVAETVTAPVVTVIGEPPAVPNRHSPTTVLEANQVAGDRPQLLRFVKDVSSYFPETMLFDVVNIR